MTDRRAFLAAALAAPIAIAAPAIAATPKSDTPFAVALAAYEAALSEEEHFDRTVLEPRSEQYQDLCEKVPHKEIEWEASRFFNGETWSTADESRIQEVRYFLDPKHVINTPPEQESYHRACLAFQAAVDAREKECDAIYAALGLEAIDARSAELGCRRFEAQKRAPAAPVASMDELVKKMQLAEKTQAWARADVRAAILAEATDLSS